MDQEMKIENKPQEEDLFTKMKKLEAELELLSIQEEYLKDEQRHLKSEYIRSKEEIKRIQSVYLATGFLIARRRKSILL